MHQPLAIANDIGMGIGNGHIVHDLGRLYEFNRFDDTNVAIDVLQLRADGECISGDPRAICCQEGMLRCGLDGLAIDSEEYRNGIFVGPSRRGETVARTLLFPQKRNSPEYMPKAVSLPARFLTDRQRLRCYRCRNRLI